MTAPVRPPNARTPRGQGQQVVCTPPALLLAVEELFGRPITCDLAASPENAVADDFFSEARSALDEEPWPSGTGGVLWCNPPFSMFAKFTPRALRECRRGADPIVMLTLASLGANWWRYNVHDRATVIPIERVRFVGHDYIFPNDLSLVVYDRETPPGYLPRWDWKTPELRRADRELAAQAAAARKAARA